MQYLLHIVCFSCVKHHGEEKIIPFVSHGAIDLNQITQNHFESPLQGGEGINSGDESMVVRNFNRTED